MADCFITRWYGNEAERSWLRLAAEDAKSGDKGRGGAAVLIQLSKNAETK